MGRNCAGKLDIWAQDRPTQPKQLLHFAKVFAKNLRENAAVERRKYAAAKDYRRRARTWTTSHPDATPATRSRKEAPAPERKKMYSDHQKEIWRSRMATYSQDPLKDETQYIDNWLLGDKLWAPGVLDDNGNPVDSHPWGSTRDLWVGAWTDILKVMMMDAAMCTTPLKRRKGLRDAGSVDEKQHMDTLFLLVHHPTLQTSIKGWTHEGDGCCNMESGLICIIEAALQSYLYFNMLYVLCERGSKICDIDHSTTIDQVRLSRNSTWPRPYYMNTQSWRTLLYLIDKGHNHHPQEMMYAPLLYPAQGQNFTITCSCGEFESPPFHRTRWSTGGPHLEADVLTAAESSTLGTSTCDESVCGSAAALKEFMRGLWSLLINYEMLWRDMDEAPQWDIMVFSMLETLFSGISGKYRSLYMYDIYEHNLSSFVEGKTTFPVIWNWHQWEQGSLPREDIPAEVVLSCSRQNRKAKQEAKREARRKKRALSPTAR
ncbi:Hypothetical protein D9617_9g026240 [Elsinoe fawcettii]|nr:Hypothetical protein D9617_9g026240 [Elsinoe fawcettii]